MTAGYRTVYFTSMLINEIVKYDTADSLSKVFLALGDPTRRAILESLSKGEATVSELAKPFALSMPAISRHLKVLERAGLISRGRNAQWRPCRLEAATLKEGADYMNSYRELWEASLGNLKDYLASLQAEQSKKRGEK
ncbi:MAG: transcriptional regulator, ArsR family [Candidatus Saccharibacteria bacterium]|nr:transcriptional regulator, ArsR family [Candidatus Saccharibacteria bacterium]